MSGNVGALTGAAGIVVIAGLGIIWLGRACGRGALARNQFVGIRTRWTMASDAAWDAGHRAGAHRMVMSGVGTAAIGVVAVAAVFLSVLGVSETGTAVTVVALVLCSTVWMVGWLLAATVTADRAAKAVVG
ncbi:SdpI family protein [Gordonia phthalatica]|uniref:SdpI family protein n=1 Tax=Gordonia phthalatica TaxID=1136941 RepID=UPI0007826314|nr:SdpI family protein [Gordonia phthalatica]